MDASLHLLILLMYVCILIQNINILSIIKVYIQVSRINGTWLLIKVFF